jgi:hypothetical protein
MIIRRFARLINSIQRICLSDQRPREKAGTHVILSQPAAGRRSEGSLFISFEGNAELPRFAQHDNSWIFGRPLTLKS